MIIRTTQRKSGIVEYLKTGRNSDYPDLEREDRDKVIPLFGDLNILDKTLKKMKKKKYKTDYWHTTISFTDYDFKQFYDFATNGYDINKITELVEEYIKIFLAGYDSDEYVAYAELHYPILKRDKHGNLRLPHIHLVIAKLDATGKQLKSFRGTIKNNDLVQTYLAKKYDLDLPVKHLRDEYEREKRRNLIIPEKYRAGLNRKKLLNLINYDYKIKTKLDLELFFEENGLEYRLKSNRKKSWYEVKIGKKWIKLRGKDAEFVELLAEGKSFESAINNYENYEEKREREEEYKTNLWLKIAQDNAKKPLWELKEEIEKLVSRQKEFVSKRRKKPNPKSIDLEKKVKVKKAKTDGRVANPVDYFVEENGLKKWKKEYIAFLKENLKPQLVLEYVKNTFPDFDLSKYEVIGYKINNKTNKQKPKNVIDFLNKEVKIPLLQAFEIAHNLMNLQREIESRYEQTQSNTQSRGMGR
jgi:hypothetical protein